MQLYHQGELLDADLERCRLHGFAVASFDCARWGDGELFHDDLAAGLGLPGYYGRNLDALDELLIEVADGRVGFAVDRRGAVVVLRRFDQLHTADRARAHSVLDIFYRAAIEGLVGGRPMACLVHSDDPGLQPISVGQVLVPWHPGERPERLRGTE